MILRSVMKHVRDQNWFAVGIDFFIVIVGVFIGIQVANWNEARQHDKLGEVYLVRLGEDLSAMDTYLVGMIAETEKRSALTLNLLSAAASDIDFDSAAAEDALIEATHAFFTEGWRTPRFTVVRAVFDDLQSTGNLSLINSELRKRITSYYAGIDVRLESFDINRDWSLRNDSRMVAGHDIYRWDRTFEKIVGALDADKTRDTILAARDDLARLATMFHYIETASLDHYQAALNETRELTSALMGTLGAGE